jgi:hypothetical protein
MAETARPESTARAREGEWHKRKHSANSLLKGNFNIFVLLESIDERRKTAHLGPIVGAHRAAKRRARSSSPGETLSEKELFFVARETGLNKSRSRFESTTTFFHILS